MADEKALRVGVIQGVNVIEERIIPVRGPITFGTAPGNTFVLQGADLPKSVLVFDVSKDKYQLVFSNENSGRIETPTSKDDLHAVLAQAEKMGDKYRLPMDENTRGRVRLSEEITVLWHFVPTPPVIAAPVLPDDMRTSFWRSLEPIFTAVLLGSFLIHSTVAVLVKVIEPPKPADSLEELRRVVETLAPPPKTEVPIATNTPTDTGTKGEDNAPGKGEDRPKKGGGGGGDGGAPKGGKKGAGTGGGGGVGAGDRTALRNALAGRGILQLIGGRGGGCGDGGAVGSVFGAGSNINDNIGDALNGTAGVGIAGAGGGDGVTRRGTGGGDGTGGDGSGGGIGGGAADIGVLQTGGGGSVDTGAKTQARVVARVRTDDVEAVDGKIDRKAVKATLARRSEAFQACYETALKANSKLAGKLVVEFTIGESGKVTDASVVKDGLGSGAVSACVLEVLKRLRFPASEDGEVTINNSFVFQPGG